jgi:putative endonuclease
MDDRERKMLGLLGEQMALAHLLANGLKLITRNYRCKMGEIDLVMLDGATLVLVEVRYRSSRDYGGPAASVTWEKQLRLARAAEHLLMKRAELKRYPARFDVIAITTGAAGDAATEPKVDWIKRAFTLSATS